MAMSDTTRPEGGDGPETGDPRFGEGADPALASGDAVADGFGQDRGEGQLDLGDDDTRLPWLEGADDEDETAGSNAGQLNGFVLLGLLLLGLIVGGIWWLTHRGSDDERIADGSTIEAPTTPYKEKPEDPGGLVAQGTGDASYRVSEGKAPSARLGSAEPVAQPGFDTVNGQAAPASGKTAAAAPAKTPTTTPATTPAPAQATGGQGAPAPAPVAEPSGVGVQIGAYSTRQQAEAGWSTLSRQYADLSGMRYRIVEGKADIGTVHRLQALAPDRADATALCNRLKKAGLSCYVRP